MQAPEGIRHFKIKGPTNFLKNTYNIVINKVPNNIKSNVAGRGAGLSPAPGNVIRCIFPCMSNFLVVLGMQKLQEIRDI